MSTSGPGRGDDKPARPSADLPSTGAPAARGTTRDADTGVMDRASRALMDLARGVLGELDLDVVLERVLDSAKELSGARYAALGVLNESRTELARFLTKGIDEQTHARIGALPRGRGVLGELIENPAPLRLTDVGQHPRSYGFPYGHPSMRTFLGVPILVDGTPYGNLYLTEKAGGADFSSADEEGLMILAEFAGVAIDHARRYTGASQSRDELGRTVAALQATVQIARALGGETDLEVILELIAKRGRALVKARTLLIELLDRGDLVVAAGAGELPPGIVGKRMARESSLAGQALRTLTPVRLEEGLNRTRFEEHGGGKLGVQAKTGLVVPLAFRGRPYGTLVALDRLGEPAEFNEQDEQLLEAFAASAASAVATAQTVASERYRQRLAAAEAERQRWARELHDETLQSLGALRIALSTSTRSQPAAMLKQLIGSSVKQLDAMIADLRGLITELRPAALDELGVQAALDALAERTARTGIEVDVSVDLAYEQGREESRHSPELETTLYRVAQEALNNASKHAQARRIVVEVREDQQTVHLSIRDDGRGFDLAAETAGFGLLGMRERTELLGGQMKIESRRDHGTVVRVTLPVSRVSATAEATHNSAAL